MPRQSAPIQEVARLLDLVPYLSTHSYISVKELAAEFGVSEREMVNELTALSMCGLPGYTPYELIEVFFDSGFVTINNHDSLDIPRALTNLEVASLLLGLALMRENASEHPELLERIDLLTEQFRKILGDTVEVKGETSAPHSALIEKAIATRRTLQIKYISSTRDEDEQREIDPLSLYSENSFTYLNAYCHQAGGYRNFRLDRITSAELGERTREEVQNPTTEKAEASEVSLRVRGSRRAVAEFLSLDSIPNDGSISYQTYSNEWAERAVISFSPDIDMAAPMNSREAIHRRLSAILALYSS